MHNHAGHDARSTGEIFETGYGSSDRGRRREFDMFTVFLLRFCDMFIRNGYQVAISLKTLLCRFINTELFPSCSSVSRYLFPPFFSHSFLPTCLISHRIIVSITLASLSSVSSHFKLDDYDPAPSAPISKLLTCHHPNFTKEVRLFGGSFLWHG